MQCNASETERRQARWPHELFMINLAFFHLLLTPASIFLGIGRWGLLIPPFFSGLVILYSWLRSRRAGRTGPWFVASHWRLAMRRYRWLVIAYAASAAIIGLGALIGAASSDPRMGDILGTVFVRIGVMPTVIMVFVNFALENSGLAMAKGGEVPDRLAEQHPPPPGLCDEPQAQAEAP